MNPTFPKSVYIDFTTAAFYCFFAKKFRLLPDSSLKVQMLAFSVAPLIKILKNYHKSDNRTLNVLYTFLPCAINGIVSHFSGLPWKSILFNTAVLGGSQVLQVAIAHHQNKNVIDHIIKEIDSSFDPKTKKIYTALLQKTQDINATHEGWTLLHYCIYQFSYMIQDEAALKPNPFHKGRKLLGLIKYLITHGADIHKRDLYGRTPIYFSSALYDTHEEFNKKFWKLFPNSPELLNPNNSVIQHLHVASSLVEKMVIDLIEKGAKTDAVDKYGRTPLHCAVINSRFDPEFLNVKALIYYEPASLEAHDNFINYPLFYAALFGSEELFQFVLERSSVNVILKVKEKWEQLRISEDKEQEYEKKFEIYDPIYNIPLDFKIIFGGGREKKEKQVKTKLETAVNNKKTQYEKDNIFYDTYHDGHGWKHLIDEATFKRKFPKQRDFIESTKGDGHPAKFFPNFGGNYLQLIKNCVEAWVDKGADENDKFVEFPGNVGADNGHLTTRVEIYFSTSGGAHIRPKYLP